MPINSANRLGAFLLSAALLVAAGVAARAQSTKPPAESSQMQQIHQALSLAQHGDKQGAMNIVLTLVQQHPDFAPAIKLKGMLLEDAGRTAEAAAA